MNQSGGSDDDKTQIVPRRNEGGGQDRDKTVIASPGIGGLSMPPPPPRGQVIGTDRRAPPAPAARGTSPAASHQDKTIFVSSAGESFEPVVGWLAVIAGPGKGQFRPIFYGQNSIGRDPKQRISFDFGDQKISRETHAFIVYDEVVRKFFIRDNGKSNLVRHNGNLVMMPTEMNDRDHISIGDTTLLFVPLCNAHFDWLDTDEPGKS